MLSATTTGKLALRRVSGFQMDIMNGLKANQKYLQSKYFYDEEGDKLFQRIMASPEYYPTRCEMEIMQHRSGEIAEWFAGASDDSFDLVELGAGDATKSWWLLREMLRAKMSFTYYPIDISSNVIGWLENKLPASLPGLRLHGCNGEYLDQMEYVNHISSRRKVVLFMGANIGNMTVQQATVFCRQLRDAMRPGDLLMIGFDLKKHPKTILDAYNDRDGVTKAFNLNLLNRINREMGADFDVARFEHYPVYDPGTGSCKSYLVSLAEQTVHFANGEEIGFAENEAIYMEISQKYDLLDTEYMARNSGFKPVHMFMDSKKWFADVLWERLP